MDVGWLSPWTSRPSSASGGDHRRRRAPTVADPLGDGRRASLGLPGGGPAGGRGHSPTPGSRLCAHPPVSEPSDGPGWRTRLPGPLPAGAPAQVKAFEDRKSTRLNSSHVKISYALFCLKKTNKTATRQLRRARVEPASFLPRLL